MSATQQAKFHVEQGAERAVIKSGGSLDVESGGEIDVESGGSLKIAGTAVSASAATLNAAAIGVAAGYKVARGVVTPTATPQDVVTGLTTVVAVAVSLRDAPTLTHMFASGSIGDQAGSPAAGSFTLVTKKPTGAADVTPIDATTPWVAVNWIAIGT